MFYIVFLPERKDGEFNKAQTDSTKPFIDDTTTLPNASGFSVLLL